jgi:hypothetical protein
VAAPADAGGWDKREMVEPLFEKSGDGGGRVLVPFVERRQLPVKATARARAPTDDVVRGSASCSGKGLVRLLKCFTVARGILLTTV